MRKEDPPQQLEEISLSSLNKLLGSVQNFYMALLDQGWSLPKFNRNSITFHYLWSVFMGECFRIKRSEVKKGILFKKVSKKYLFEQITLIVENFGFSNEKIPDKEWLIDILFTLEPNNEIFTKTKATEEDPKVQVPLKYALLILISLKWFLC